MYELIVYNMLMCVDVFPACVACSQMMCGRIWSPQSVESEIQLSCLPFLRVAAHLKQHLFTLPVPNTHTMVSQCTRHAAIHEVVAFIENNLIINLYIRNLHPCACT